MGEEHAYQWGARAAARAQAQARGRGGSWGGFFRKVREASGKGAARRAGPPLYKGGAGAARQLLLRPVAAQLLRSFSQGEGAAVGPLGDSEGRRALEGGRLQSGGQRGCGVKPLSPRELAQLRRPPEGLGPAVASHTCPSLGRAGRPGVSPLHWGSDVGGPPAAPPSPRRRPRSRGPCRDRA